MVLHPDKYNKHVQYAWRFDPCELVPAGRQKPPPRAPMVEECVTDDEFYDVDMYSLDPPLREPDIKRFV